MAAPSYRAPLLWLLIPMIGGYVFGYFIPNIPAGFLLIVAMCSLAGAYLCSSYSSTPTQQRWWAIYFTTAVFAASLLYFQQSRKFPDIWEQLPPREAFVDIKVKRLYASTVQNRISGIGEITKTDNHLTTICGYPVYFSVEVDGHSIDRGDRFSARGVLSYLPSQKTPSLFENYLIGQSIPLTFTRGYLTALPVRGNQLERIVAHLRKKAINTLGISLEEYGEERSIYLGMILGIKGELSAENKSLFLKTGTLHLFAISGLHVGIIAVTLASIFLVLRIPRQASVILGLSLLFVYVEVTGASPSAIRAFAMTAFFWIGKSVARQMPPFQALVASAVTVLIISPNQLFSAGFQLSYTVVTGILLWGIPLYQALRENYYMSIPEKVRNHSRPRTWFNKIWDLVAGTFCISLAASVASAPLSIMYFEILAPFAVFLNMVLVPIASLVIISGLFSILSQFCLLGGLAAFFNHGPLLLIKITNRLLEQLVSLPSSYIEISWSHNSLGFVSVLLFLTSLLACHGLRCRKRWLFLFPIAVTIGMIFLNSIII